MLEWIYQHFADHLNVTKRNLYSDNRYTQPLYTFLINKLSESKEILSYLYKPGDMCLDRKYNMSRKMINFADGENIPEIKKFLYDRRLHKLQNKHGQMKHKDMPPKEWLTS